MVVRLQVRHDTKANWEHHNPILAVGEIGIEIDNEVTPNRMKIGNGNDRWLVLPYYDAQFMHISDIDEEVLGEKTFKDTLTLDCNVNMTEGHNIIGQIEKAEQDSLGNVISDYYQRKLAFDTYVIDEDTDWNSIITEGTYAVNVLENGYNSTKHTPYNFSANMSKQGILTVSRTCDNKILQTFTPTKQEDANTVMAIVYRFSNTLLQNEESYYNWSDWANYTDSDNTLVHTSGTEYIDGVKTFNDAIIIENGNIILGDSNTMAVKVQRGSASLLEDNQLEGMFIATETGNITLRPNGRTDDTGEVTINNQGIIDGKVTCDSDGNNINATYIKKRDVAPYAKSSLINLPTLLSEEEYPTEYQSVVDRKIESFDITKFTRVGTPLCEEDGIASGFSASNYFTTSLALNGPWTIKFKFNLNDIETAVTPLFYLSQYNKIEIGTEGNLILSASSTNDADHTITFVTEFEPYKDYLLKVSFDGISSYTAEWTDVMEDVTHDNTITLAEAFYAQQATWLIGSNGTNYVNGSLYLKYFSVIVGSKEIFNSHDEQIDIIKEDNFTNANTSPSAISLVSDLGIASGFTLTDYLTASNISVGESFDIDFYAITGSINPSVKQVILKMIETGHSIELAIDNGKLVLSIGDNTHNTYDLAENTEYRLNLSVEGEDYSLAVNDSETYAGEIDFNFTTVGLLIGADNGSNPFNGSIDLNRLQILRNEIIIYQPCLRIPYVYSRYGVKVVDGIYKDRVDDCFEQFMTGNYFILDEVNREFQMPYDTADGYSRLLYRFRSGKTSYEYNTDLECTQTGACVANTPYTFLKPFADNNYVIPVNCSLKDRYGFTPDITTDFIAKGRITLG